METLPIGQRNNYTYRSSTTSIFALTKLQQSRHYRWMGFLQQFHLVIRYKKGIHNKVVDMLSKPIINTSTIFNHNSVLHESDIEQYAQNLYFKDVYANLSHGK